MPRFQRLWMVLRIFIITSCATIYGELKLTKDAEGVLDILHRLVARIAADQGLAVPRETFSGMRLEQLQLNSLDLVELSLNVESELDVDIEVQKLSSGTTFLELARIILSQIK